MSELRRPSDGTDHRAAPALPGRKLEGAVFWGLAILHLVPVWAYPYLPTQDGPHHLANAVILKDFGAPQTRYHEFFELRREPLPNWACQLLLVGLFDALQPLAAEKAVASFYVLGFAWSVRYFLGAFGAAAERLAPVGLLFLYNRCFLMGFYNYCLGLALAWAALGYCQRRREAFGARAAAAFAALCWASYFTHLLGYWLAAAGGTWLVFAAKPLRLTRLFWTAAAVAPTAGLAAMTTARPGLLGLREALGDEGGPRPVWAARTWENLSAELGSTGMQLFGSYEAWGVPLGLLVLLLYLWLLSDTAAAPREIQGEATPPPRWPMVFLGAGLAALYALLPDFLSLPVGFLKARLVLPLPIIALACLRPSSSPLAWRLTAAMTCGLIVLNLAMVVRLFGEASAELAEYAAAADLVGRDRVIFAVPPPGHPRGVSWLEHASDYYCLTTRNVNLDNFQASVPHFPVQFRPGVQRARDDLHSYPGLEAVDVILVWEGRPSLGDQLERRYREVYRGGRLRVLEKR